MLHLQKGMYHHELALLQVHFKSNVIPATSSAVQRVGIDSTKPLTKSALLQTHAMSVNPHPDPVNPVKIGVC